MHARAQNIFDLKFFFFYLVCNYLVCNICIYFSIYLLSFRSKDGSLTRLLKSFRSPHQKSQYFNKSTHQVSLPAPKYPAPTPEQMCENYSYNKPKDWKLAPAYDLPEKFSPKVFS